MTPVWLVTSSENYYPCSGTADWVLCTTDEDAARATFESLPCGDQHVCLIRIDNDGGYITDDSR